MNIIDKKYTMRVLHILLLIIMVISPTVYAQEPPPAKVVVTKVIQREVAKNTSFLGLLYYDRISQVSSEVTGLVKTVGVRKGDYVKKGDRLLHLDTEILDKEIVLARTRIDQIDLRLQHAEKNYKKLELLFSKDSVSEKDFDNAFYAYHDYLKEKQTTEIQLEILLIKKRKSIITAPFDGVILEKNVDAGDWVKQDKQLVSIASTNDLFVRVPISETLLQFITVGETVPVIFHAFNKELVGTIEDIDPTADPKTKNIFLKIRIPKQTQVAENMSATVFVPISAKRQLSIIPRDALVKFQGKDFVYTVKDEKAVIQPVNIVTYLGEKVGVDNSDLVTGMPVVIEGTERLRPDQSVVVTGEK